MRALLLSALILLLAVPAAHAATATSRSAWLDTADGRTLRDLGNGTFVLARSTTDPFEVQVLRDGGANLAVAVRIGSYTMIWNAPESMLSGNGGEWSVSPDSTYPLPGGGTIATGPGPSSPPLTFTSTVGDTVLVTTAEDGDLTVAVTPGPGRAAGEIAGLLGRIAGDGALVDRDGAGLPSLASAQAVWSVTGAASLVAARLERSPGYGCQFGRGTGDIGWRWKRDSTIVPFDSLAPQGQSDVVAALDAGQAYLDRALTPLAESGTCAADYVRRQVVFDIETPAPNGLRVTRKAGWSYWGGFTREITTLRNPTDRAITTTLYQKFDGPMPALRVRSPRGDGVLGAGDGWFAAARPDGWPAPADRVTATVLQGTDARRRDSVDAIFPAGAAAAAATFADGAATPVAAFEDVVVPPRGAATFVTLSMVVPRGPGYASGASLANGAFAAQALAGAPGDALRGLTPEEALTLRNFVAPDADRDGVANDADVCLYEPDPAQADWDRDGRGDACDPDRPPAPKADAPPTETPRADPAPAPRAAAATPAPAAPGAPTAPRAATRLTLATKASGRTLTVTGRVVAPRGATCAGGAVRVKLTRGGRTLATRLTTTTAACTFRVSARPGRGKVAVSARFAGTPTLLAAGARTSVRV